MAGCKSGVRPEEILSSELYGMLMKAKGEGAPLSPAAVMEHIQDAEAAYEEELQTFLAPTRIVAEPRTRIGTKAEVPSTDYDRTDVAYAYERGMFSDDRWAWLDLNYRPVISVERLFFAWPGSLAGLRDVPADWIRLDEHAGRIQIIPTGGQAILMTLDAYILSALAGSRGLPQSIFIDYTAGLDENAMRETAAGRLLRKCVRIRATLSLFPTLSNVRTRGLGSQSLSEDGLSQSQSAGTGKWGPYTGAIELWRDEEKRLLEIWRDAEGGVPITVFC